MAFVVLGTVIVLPRKSVCNKGMYLHPEVRLHRSKSGQHKFGWGYAERRLLDLPPVKHSVPVCEVGPLLSLVLLGKGSGFLPPQFLSDVV